MRTVRFGQPCACAGCVDAAATSASEITKPSFRMWARIASVLLGDFRFRNDLGELADVGFEAGLELLWRRADALVAAGAQALHHVGQLEHLRGLALQQHDDLARRAGRHEKALPG